MQEINVYIRPKICWLSLVVIVMCTLLSSTMLVPAVMASEDADLSEKVITLSAKELLVGSALEVSGCIPQGLTSTVMVHYTQPDTVILTRNVTVEEGVFCDRFTPQILGCWAVQAYWVDLEDHPHESLTKQFCVYQTQPMLECKVAPLSITVGSTIPITGFLDPSHNDVPILLKIRRDSEDWKHFVTVHTSSNGEFSYDWTPMLTGEYAIKAYFSGSDEYKSAISEVCTVYVTAINHEGNTTDLLNETPDILSLESNSTISELLFDTEHAILSFTVTGPDHTTGYVQVMVAKELMASITGLTVNVDGAEIAYTTTETQEAWLISILYPHSSHTVQMILMSPGFSLSQLILVTGSIAALIVVLFVYRRQSNRTTLLPSV